jgi:hypothetical protein
MQMERVPRSPADNRGLERQGGSIKPSGYFHMAHASLQPALE